jgi:hypothetical protein
MFPKADESIILDVLAMVDNNVQKASEQLKSMGYEKKEMTPAPRLSHRKKEEHQKKETIEPTPPPKMKTAEEKKKCKKKSFPKSMIFIFNVSIFSESSASKPIQRNPRKNHLDGP